MAQDTDPQGSVGGDAPADAPFESGAIPPATPPAVATTGALAPGGAETVDPGTSETIAPGKSKARKPNQTLAGRVWVAIGVAVVLLVLLIIFISENSRSVTVKFLGANGTISLALALIIAALGGVVITLLVGTARILQLRRQVKRNR